MKRKHYVVLALVAMLAGCAATGSLSGQMAAWQGQDVATAIDAWGQPEHRQPYGEQTVLVWRDRAVSPSGYVADAAMPVTCERMLAVAADGRITGWRWRGDACEAVGAGRRDTELAALR